MATRLLRFHPRAARRGAAGSPPAPPARLRVLGRDRRPLVRAHRAAVGRPSARRRPATREGAASDGARHSKPPKSRHSRREIPLSAALVSALRTREGDADALVFATSTGTPLHYSATCGGGFCSRPPRRLALDGPGSTRSGIRARRCSSSAARTPSRCSGGSATIRPRSRSRRTFICSIRAWVRGSTWPPNSARVLTGC